MLAGMNQFTKVSEVWDIPTDFTEWKIMKLHYSAGSQFLIQQKSFSQKSQISFRNRDTGRALSSHSVCACQYLSWDLFLTADFSISAFFSFEDSWLNQDSYWTRINPKFFLSIENAAFSHWYFLRYIVLLFPGSDLFFLDGESGIFSSHFQTTGLFSSQ